MPSRQPKIPRIRRRPSAGRPRLPWWASASHRALGLTLAGLFALVSAASAQDDVLARGNELIARGSYAECETLFEEALEARPENHVYRSQLALCMTQQRKFGDAEKQLDRVLSTDADNVGALWYLSLNHYLAGHPREAIARFRQTAALLDDGAPQHIALSFYLGNAFQQLLQTEGLTSEETDAMVSAFREYLRLDPGSERRAQIESWLSWVEENRPPEGDASVWLAASELPVREDGSGQVFGETIEDAELPDPEPGFVWRRMPEIGAAFQMPEHWHFKREERDGTLAYFLTRENIDELGHFQTGLTINVVRNAEQRVGRPAADYAEHFAALSCTRGKKLDSWQRQTGVIGSFSCTTESTDPARPVVVHHLAIGNERTDTLYIIFFESLIESWDEAWESVGKTMMELFLIDDEV